MAGGEIEYLALMEKVLSHGRPVMTRNGIRHCLFGEQIKFDLRDGFPMLTTKKLHWKSIKVELLWFLKGHDNVEYLHKHGVSIWDEWAEPDGNVGPIYGVQWRHWSGGRPQRSIASNQTPGCDQIAELLENLKSDPYSTRHLVTAWEPLECGLMALPPCHYSFQMNVFGGEEGQPDELSCHMTMRSADLFLGVPFNIASYALLTELIALHVGMKPTELTISFGNVHLYDNHLEQAKLQLSRTPLEHLPTLRIHKRDRLEDYEPQDIKLMDYRAHDHIPAPVSR